MMSIFPNCVKNVRLQALSDSVKLGRRLMKKILNLLNCDLPTPIRSELPSRVFMIEIKSIMRLRQVNNYDIRIGRNICTFVIM